MLQHVVADVMGNSVFFNWKINISSGERISKIGSDLRYYYITVESWVVRFKKKLWISVKISQSYDQK